MSIAQTSSLLSQVKELELVGRKNTTGLFAGNYLSTILGHGMEFHEARKYVQGESIRFIDWNMTARRNEVYVKRFREEREREIFLAVDVSPSMDFGTQERTKLECALEIAATLGFSAVTNGDKVGLVTYSDKVTATFLPKKSRSHLFAILKSLVSQKNNPRHDVKQTNIESAIAAIQNQKGRKFMIFFISDFIEHDIPDDLKLIQNRHDVSLIHIYDPMEYEDVKSVFFPFYSPEGTKHTASAKPGAFGNFEEIENFLKGSSLKYGIDTVSISTKDKPAQKLLSYFKEKQNRKTR